MAYSDTKEFVQKSLKEQGFDKVVSRLIATELAAMTHENEVSKMEVTAIPSHSEFENIMPNELARCALFSINKNDKGGVINRTFKCYAPHGATIQYKGAQLTQSHKRLMLEIINQAQTANKCKISVSSLAKAAGFGDSGTATDNLLELIDDLKANCLTITSDRLPNRQVKISLIARAEVDSVKKGARDVKTATLYLDDEIVKLFGGSQYAKITKEHTQSLCRNANLAHWLLTFYATHKDPSDIKVQTLYQFTESKSSQKEFKRMLQAALAQLIEVGFFHAACIVENEVKVVRA